jgi:DNA repair exonuclease SbcCD ATPase subunit
MRIKRVKLDNYCQHKNLEVDLTGNVVGIVGRNGSGKSNFVSAINYCVTGEFERKKDRLISMGESTGSIEIDIEINQSLTVTVFRSLKGNKAEATFSDSREKIIGADNVNEILLELMGVDKTTLKNIVFVGQDELGALLYSRDSERERLAQQFFGIERAVRIERILADKYNRIHVPEVRVSPGSLREALDSKRIMLEMEKSNLQDKQSRFNAQRLQDLISLSSTWKNYLDQMELKRNANLRIDDISNEITDLSALLISKKQECDGLSVTAVKQRLSEEIRKASEYGQYQSTKKSLDQYRAAYESMLAAEPPCTQEFIDKLSEDIESAEKVGSGIASRVNLRQQIMGGLKHSQFVDCPICFSELDLSCVTEVQNALESEQADMERVSHLNELKLRKKNWEQSLNKHVSDLAFMKSRMEDLQASEILQKTPEPAQVEKWQTNLSFVENLFNEVKSLEDRIKEKQLKLSEAQREASLIATPPEISQGVNNITDVVSEIENLQNIRSEIKSIESNIDLLNSQINYEQTALEEAEIVSLEAYQSSRVRESISKIRRVFHPEGAPKDLVSRRVERMEAKINEYLGLLGVMFTIKGVGGFNFEAIFPDKPHPIKITELSGGQKIDLSLAFRFAACESFSSSAGLLVLDEPSVYLDEDTKQHLVEVFERLRDMAQQMRMQFLVVTHERSLLGCFDQLIEFGGTVV